MIANFTIPSPSLGKNTPGQLRNVVPHTLHITRHPAPKCPHFSPDFPRILYVPARRCHLCRHSFVVIVFFSMSRHIGHISSLCKLLGDTAISVPSVIASWGALCSSYKVNSQVLLGTAAHSILNY